MSRHSYTTGMSPPRSAFALWASASISRLRPMTSRAGNSGVEPAREGQCRPADDARRCRKRPSWVRPRSIVTQPFDGRERIAPAAEAGERDLRPARPEHQRRGGARRGPTDRAPDRGCAACNRHRRCYCEAGASLQATDPGTGRVSERGERDPLDLAMADRPAGILEAAEPRGVLPARPETRRRSSADARYGALDPVTVVHELAVDIVADAVRFPDEGVVVEALVGPAGHGDQLLVAALARDILVELHLGGVLAQDLEVDLVMRLLVGFADIGEEGGIEAGGAGRLHADLVGAVAEALAGLYFAAGILPVAGLALLETSAEACRRRPRPASSTRCSSEAPLVQPSETYQREASSLRKLSTKDFPPPKNLLRRRWRRMTGTGPQPICG